MSDTSIRDPRVDPRSGDVLTGSCGGGPIKAVIVDEVLNGEVYFWQSRTAAEFNRKQPGDLLRLPIARWRAEAASSTVEHIAADLF